MANKVSIIIPTYKRSTKIERAIKSALAQTYKNIEVIIVDDNATFPEERKRTQTIIEKYKNIVLVQNSTNLGGALSRNEGIKHATGTYVVFLDDDDEYLPKKVEQQLKFMLSKNLDASFSNELIFNEKNIFQYKEQHKKFDRKNILKYHLTEKIIGPQTFMYKKKVLQEIGGFDDIPSGQEYILMYKTIIGGYKIDYLDADLVKIYIHDGERISTGEKKLIGERRMYNLKKQYFDILNFRERQIVRFQWFVCNYRYYLRKRSCLALIYILIIVLRFPVQTIKIFYKKLAKRIVSSKYNGVDK